MTTATTVKSSSNATRSFVNAKLPDLDYGFSALEPVICAGIMGNYHHQKHHNTYVTNFNVAQEKYAEAEAKGDHATMIAMQPAIKFNGGGHVNHTLFSKVCLRAKGLRASGGRTVEDDRARLWIAFGDARQVYRRDCRRSRLWMGLVGLRQS